MKNKPPPKSEPGLLETLIPVQSNSNDMEQIQQRLRVHTATAPALSAWLGRFTRLAHTVDANATLDEVYASLDAIVKNVRTCKGAADAGAQARGAAQRAQADAELAAQHAAEASSVRCTLFSSAVLHPITDVTSGM